MVLAPDWTELTVPCLKRTNPGVMNLVRSLSRRDVLSVAAGLVLAPLLARRLESAALPTLKITSFELIPVRATSRTVWLFVRLRTDAGLTGLGEASDAFGFANTTAANVTAMRKQLATLFAFIDRVAL